jgi:hypothetical protein
MTRSHSLALALLLGVAVSACDIGDAVAPLIDPPQEDAIASILFSANSADPGAPAGTSLFDRLANEIKSFGGLYRNGHCAVAVVLTDMTEADHAIRVVKAALEPLRACPDGVRVHPVAGNFTYVELQRFNSSAQELLRIDGVRAIQINYQLNKLVVTVSSREVAQKVLAALPALNIPKEAISFQITGGRGPTTTGPVSTPTRTRD